MHRALLALVVIAAAACDRAAPEPRASAAPSAASAAAPEDPGVRYLEELTGGATHGDRLPLVVAIHGLGDRPEAFAPMFAGLTVKARLVVPYGEPYGAGYSWFPPGSLDDPRKLAEGTARAADRLAKMILRIKHDRPTVGRAIVTGFSQGGMLSFTLAAQHPTVVGEAFPVGGLIADALVPTGPAGPDPRPEITAFHGEADARVPFPRALDSVTRLERAGFVVRLRQYPNVGHTIPPSMRADLLREIAAAAVRATE